MGEVLNNFFKDLFESEAFRTALITVFTTIVLIIGVKLQIYLSQLTEKTKIQKLNTVRDAITNTSKDLIISAEKQFGEESQKKEAWVLNNLKDQFNQYIDEFKFSENTLKAIIQKTYEDIRSEIPTARWDSIALTTKTKKK